MTLIYESVSNKANVSFILLYHNETVYKRSTIITSVSWSKVDEFLMVSEYVYLNREKDDLEKEYQSMLRENKINSLLDGNSI